MKRKILLLYPYYYPHYKAGGPVQSIYNLAGYFENEGAFFLISLSRDIDHSVSEIPVKEHAWQTGPQGEHVYYTTSFSFALIRRVIREVKPDVIFVNGLFNAVTTVPGVLLARWYGIKLLISPRGMLQRWALKQKRSMVKGLYIQLLKMILGNKTVWHATDEQEKSDILKNFGQSQLVNIASNVPRQVIQSISTDFLSEDRKIKLVFLSLINPNKNLHLIIEQVKRYPEKFTLDIYGPVRNKEYWDTCLQEFNSMSSVAYKGEVQPWKVQQVLQQYHFFVLPTQGENFGHAIFDALSCGVPVIVSKNTPWQKIEESGAGFYLDITSKDSIDKSFDNLILLSDDQYQSLRQKSLTYAKSYYESKDFRKEYQFLFS